MSKTAYEFCNDFSKSDDFSKTRGNRNGRLRAGKVRAPSVMRWTKCRCCRSSRVSRTTLYRMEKTGRFPRPIYISPNRRVWFADEIIAWQNAVDELDPNRGRGKGRPQRASDWLTQLRNAWPSFRRRLFAISRRKFRAKLLI